jgi:hypothetical protein
MAGETLLARISNELQWRDREDGRATRQPQRVGSEAYLNGTSQGSTPEDVRKDGHIRGRSRPLMKYPGYWSAILWRNSSTSLLR